MFQEKAMGMGARELAALDEGSSLGAAFRESEALIFQLTNGVTQLKRLVDVLGTPKDTVQHRQRISDQNARIQGLAKQTQEKLKLMGSERGSMTEQQSAKARKLMQDFGAVLQEYKATQKAAAEREAQSLPRTPPAASTSGRGPAAAAGGASSREDAAAEAASERQALLQQQQVAESRQLDNSIAYNESLIEERDHGIAEIQRQIGEVNEMFQDLAVLINDQGQQLQTIDVHIATTADRVREGQRQLVQAERSQRAARNKCLFVWLAAGVVVAVILIVLFA